MRTARPYPGEYPVFCIGGSAGAVEAFIELAAALPPAFPAPVFLMLHRKNPESTGRKSLMPELLARRARLPVITPADGELLRAGRIYVSDSAHHMVVDDNHIFLKHEPQAAGWRPSIDVLFESVAREFGERAVAMLLSGMLDDGVEGLRAITREGGITVVQEPDDAIAPDLPQNGIEGDHPSYVAPACDLPVLMCELARLRVFPDQEQVLHQAAARAAGEKRQARQGRPG